MWRKYSQRVIDYFQQSGALFVSPRRFMSQWATGEREALNPVRFMSIGLVLLVSSEWLGHRIVVGLPSTSVLARTFFLIPFVTQLNALMMGFFAHPIIRGGSPRAPLRASIAASIFASMGPATLLYVAGWLVTALIHGFTGSQLAVPMVPTPELRAEFKALYGVDSWPVLPWALYLLSQPYSVLTLAGVHRARWWKALLAVVLSLILTTVAVSFVSVLIGFVMAQLGLLSDVKDAIGAQRGALK